MSMQLSQEQTQELLPCHFSDMVDIPGAEPVHPFELLPGSVRVKTNHQFHPGVEIQFVLMVNGYIVDETAFYSAGSDDVDKGFSQIQKARDAFTRKVHHAIVAAREEYFSFEKEKA